MSKRRTRKRYEASFKARVALAAVRGDKTVSELSGQFSVHGNLISQWKRKLLADVERVFSEPSQGDQGDREALLDDLYQQIGRLKVELEWLKKKLPSSSGELRTLVDRQYAALSIVRQCQLVGLPRSSCYYTGAGETAENLALMCLLDKQYLKTPFSGSRGMVEWLRREGHAVNRKRVQRLMRCMGLEAIYPRPRTSIPNAEHKIYPYLLRNLLVSRPNQVWASDITYVPLARGFMYLVAIMDWHSRYVISWRLSNTLESDFCVAVLEEALAFGRPEIFNTDQGSQFTSRAFTGVLEMAGIRISMDGRGRALDNVFIERLWRSVKYENIYLHGYETVNELATGLTRYFDFYRFERPHMALDYHTPYEVYAAGPRGRKTEKKFALKIRPYGTEYVHDLKRYPKRAHGTAAARALWGLAGR